MVLKVCGTCPTCQNTMKSTKHYGHLGECMCGPYWSLSYWEQVQQANTKTMVCNYDRSCHRLIWSQRAERQGSHIGNQSSGTDLANQIPLAQWNCLWQRHWIHGQFAQMIEEEYGIIHQGLTTRNSQANSIIERINQTLDNIIRTFEEVCESGLTSNSPWDEILSAAMFA